MKISRAFTGAAVAILMVAAPVFAADGNQLCDRPDWQGKPCSDPPEITSGVCSARNECRALTASTPGGGSMNINPGNLMQLMTGILGLVNALKAGQVTGGSVAPTGTGGTGGFTGCAQYYQTSVPTNDPCAYYSPTGTNGTSINFDTSSNINTNTSSNQSGGDAVQNLISSLLGGVGNNATNAGNNGASGTSTGTSSRGVGAVSSSTISGGAGVLPGKAGANGEIRVLPNGATIVITNQPNGGNSVVAGFMGTQSTGGAQPQGLAAGWCKTRPWASNFLSLIIPPVFFDSLCSLRGYQVGLAVQSAGQAQIGTQVSLTQKNIPANAPTTTRPIQYQNVPAGPPITVDIWAQPAAVPLGQRTTIFWTSKNANSCTETSPDGSFSHSTLSGGGATVPLSGATTFSISCMGADGQHATDFVTVNLSI